jgi:hypothetical protein
VRSRSQVVLVAVALLLLVAASAVVVYVFPPGGSRPPSDCCSFSITNVTVDRTNGTAYTYYYIKVDVAFNGQGSLLVIPPDFQVLSNESTVFSAASDPNLVDNLNYTRLADGQHDSGSVAFRLNDSAAPVLMKYSGGGVSMEASVPPVSKWVSRVDSVDVSLTGALGAWSGFASLQNSTQAYQTGQRILVRLLLLPNSASTVRSFDVESVQSGGSVFNLKSSSPDLPLTVDVSQGAVTMELVFLAPARFYSGSLTVDVNMTAA